MGDEVRWWASDHYLSPSIAAFGAEVNDVVGLADYLQVMLHDHHRIALIHQRLQDV